LHSSRLTINGTLAQQQQQQQQQCRTLLQLLSALLLH
jgi:hypothetical protein